MVIDIKRFSHDLEAGQTLPKRLKDRVGTDGAVLIENVPATEDWVLRYASAIGTLDLGIDEERSGPPVMALRHDGRKSGTTDRPAYFTATAFPLHTDLAFVERPPKYLLTLCIEPDDAGGGITLVCDGREAWNALSAATRRILERTVYSVRNAPNTGKGGCRDRAVHEYDGQSEIWRFRADSLMFPDECLSAVRMFEQSLAAHGMTVSLAAGELLILDNHRVFHGRTAFDPQGGRLLLRAYAAAEPPRS